MVQDKQCWGREVEPRRTAECVILAGHDCGGRGVDGERLDDVGAPVVVDGRQRSDGGGDGCKHIPTSFPLHCTLSMNNHKNKV